MDTRRILFLHTSRTLCEDLKLTRLEAQRRQDFEFSDIEEIYPALLNLRHAALPPNPETTQNHLGPLQKLARDLKAGSQALGNAWRLGTGYRDLAVVLLEPSDRANTVSFDVMFNASTALKAVDLSLRHASRGHRDINNTIILDIRA
ncbi:hypothetical protein BJY01DRAFT_248751 [Aspergillus pseudoustus]|uniref:Uncharacterized protein n=1 Tax=Aspergillus pseudoustus TaxID=1810923 RepID=A0ABR4JTR0_9EURO